VGRIARTAATFCVVLTLETEAFLAAAFLGAIFGAAFFVLAECLAAAAFLAGRALAAVLRAEALETVPRDTVALLALGLEAGFAFTARFAVFEDVRLTVVRADDRRKPFERLLLMGLISKGCSVNLSSRRNGRQLSIASRLNQLSQVFAGALTVQLYLSDCIELANKEKHLMVNVCYVTVRLAQGG